MHQSAHKDIFKFLQQVMPKYIGEPAVIPPFSCCPAKGEILI